MEIIPVELDDISDRIGFDGHGSLDLRGGEHVALRDVGRGRRLRGLGNIEDVQFAVRGSLKNAGQARIVREVVVVDEIVIPIPPAGFYGTQLKSALPCIGLRRGLVLRKSERNGVCVPRTEKMDRLNVRRDAEGEGEHVQLD